MLLFENNMGNKTLRNPYLKAGIISLVLTIVFLNNFIFNLMYPLGEWGISVDTRHAVFTINHIIKTLLSLDFSNLLSPPMFYYTPNNLLLSETFFLQSLLALPIYLITLGNAIVTFNLLSIVIKILSFFSMFVYVYYLTKSFWPSILASVIFVFNPFIMPAFASQPVFESLFFIPLIFLMLEKLLNKITTTSVLLFFVTLSLQVISSLSYTAFLAIILPVYISIRLIQKKVNPIKLLNWGVWLGSLIFLSVISLLGGLYLKLAPEVPFSPSEIISLYSVRLSDLFFAGEANLIYGSLRREIAANMPGFASLDPTSAMKNLFWGVTPFILFVLSFKFVRKSEFKNIWLASSILMLLCICLSFGPTMTITEEFSVPGIYSLLVNLPGFEDIKIVSRFAVFMFFFLSLIAAFSILEISKKITPSRRSIFTIVIIFLIVLEFWNKPFKFDDPYPEFGSFYKFLNDQKDITTIVEIPISGSGIILPTIKNQESDADFLLYASMFHDKKLINGLSSSYPKSHKERIRILLINFPTKDKLQIVNGWGVDAVVLHKGLFLSPMDYEVAKERFLELGTELRYSTENLSLFVLK